MTVEGRTLQLFSDAARSTVRPGTSGRYRRMPASDQTPVANNPADSLKYVGTDVVDVETGPEDGCCRASSTWTA